MFSIKRLVWLLSGFCLLLVTPSVSFAHGDEEHPEAKKKDSHMQAMYALKDSIPEEYRIMERTPISPDEESLKNGKALYETKCLICHGKTGRGDGPAASNQATAPANFLDREHSGIYGPGEKFWIIGHGSGKTGMPAFAEIGLTDRWNLVNYIIYSLQKTPSVTQDNSKTRHH